MTEGVTVISKEEIIEDGKWWVVPLWTFGVFVFLSLSVVGIENGVRPLEVTTIGAAAVWFLIYPLALCKKKLTGRYRYVVTIDESASFKNLEKYVVTKNEDGTYTLEEKKRGKQ